MTNTERCSLATDLRARGWCDGPLNDHLLDDLASDLALAAELLYAELGPAMGGYPPAIVDLDHFSAVLAAVGHAVSAIAQLDGMIARRRLAVEALGVAWHDHLDDLDRWCDATDKAA